MFEKINGSFEKSTVIPLFAFALQSQHTWDVYAMQRWANIEPTLAERFVFAGVWLTTLGTFGPFAAEHSIT